MMLSVCSILESRDNGMEGSIITNYSKKIVFDHTGMQCSGRCLRKNDCYCIIIELLLLLDSLPQKYSNSLLCVVWAVRGGNIF